MDSTKIGVLEQADYVRLGRLLKGEQGRGLESKIDLEVLRNFSAQALERESANQELGRLLVFADL